MSGQHPRRRVVGATGAVILAVAGGLLWSQRQSPYDPDFDTRVVAPAYRGGGPVVLYDEGHLNTHTAGGGYKAFADLVRNDGYELRVTRQPLGAAALSGAAILVIVCARGANETNDAAAFADAEIAALEEWVRTGGALLLVTDHWPYGTAVESLARAFGVHMGAGLVEDAEHHDASLGSSHLVFSRDNGLLGDHPIVDGRDAHERIQRVLTFTGQSVLGPPEAVAILALSDTAVERPPSPPHVDTSGGDVRVHMEYGDPLTATGRAQAIAMEWGAGRIVVLGEAGMLRAQRERKGARVGMNVPGYDNRQLALNIVRWLSRVF